MANKTERLAQIIAIEKGIRRRFDDVFNKMQRGSECKELFNGTDKKYQKRNDEGEEYPPETRKVQITVQEQIDIITEAMTHVLNITAQKDYANCLATANVIVNGEIIIDKAPSTYLLFLEKQLTEIRNFVKNVPVMDPGEDWTLDENTKLFRSKPTITHKTKKTPKSITLYEATKDHPAQTQLIHEDIIVGLWETIKSTGAISSVNKKSILDRIDILSDAVKCAREQANTVIADKKDIGNKLFAFIFKG